MSQSRYCFLYLAVDGNWYMELAQRENGGRDDSETFGPFPSMGSVLKYLDRFSNPGSYRTDDSGTRPVPDISPNGFDIHHPSMPRLIWGG